MRADVAQKVTELLRANAKIKQMEEQNKMLNDKIDKMANDLRLAAEFREQLVNQMSKLQENLQQAQQEKMKMQTEMNVLNQELKTTASKLRQAEKQVAQAEAEKAAIRAEFNQRLLDKERQLTGAQDQINSLQNTSFFIFPLHHPSLNSDSLCIYGMLSVIMYEMELSRLHFLLHNLSLDMLQKEKTYNQLFSKFCLP